LAGEGTQDGGKRHEDDLKPNATADDQVDARMKEAYQDRQHRRRADWRHS
jgi:hypothetical protein